MKMKKTIEVNVEKVGKMIIVGDLNTLNLIMGTSSAGGNKHMYGIKKIKNKWHIPIKIIKERINQLEFRIEKSNMSLEIMRQVI